MFRVESAFIGDRSVVTFDTVCLILFVSLSFCLSLRLFYNFPSVSNFYFTSQYHKFPLSHAAAAAGAASTAARRRRHPKHEKRKKNQNVNKTNK
jgi:hypothetical protein